MNWGIANEVPQDVIAPTASRKEREKRGDPMPCHPDWMCITSPEYAVKASLTGIRSEKYTDEEYDAIETTRKEKEHEKATREEQRIKAADARRAAKKIQDDIDKKLREERAKANKKAGFKRKKPLEPIYVPKGHNHKKDWA